MDLVTFGLGNFRAGNHHWDTLGRQREAMDLVTFGLGITTGTGWDTTGHNGTHLLEDNFEADASKPNSLNKYGKNPNGSAKAILIWGTN